MGEGEQHESSKYEKKKKKKGIKEGGPDWSTAHSSTVGKGRREVENFAFPLEGRKQGEREFGRKGKVSRREVIKVGM